MAEDYYKILSVEPTVSQKEIEEAVMRISNIWSKNRGVTTEKMLQMQSEIQKASEVLRDPLKRLEYDIEEGYRGNFNSQTKRKKVQTIPLKLSESLESLQIVKIPGQLDYDKLEKSIAAIETNSAIKMGTDIEPSATSDSKINYDKHRYSFDPYMKNEKRSHLVDSEIHHGMNTSDGRKTDNTSETITHKNASLNPSIKPSVLFRKAIPVYEPQSTMSILQHGTKNGGKVLQSSLKSVSGDTRELSEEHADINKSKQKEEEVIPIAKEENKLPEGVMAHKQDSKYWTSVDDDKLEELSKRSVSQNISEVNNSKRSDAVMDLNISINDSDRESDAIASLKEVPKSKIISDDILHESKSPKSKDMSRDGEIKSSDEDQIQQTVQNTNTFRNESSLKDSHTKDINGKILSGEDILEKILEQVDESPKERNMKISEEQQIQKLEDLVHESAPEDVNIPNNISGFQSRLLKEREGVKASHSQQEILQTEDELSCRSSKDVSKVYMFKPEELNAKHTEVVSQSIEDCVANSLSRSKSSVQSKESSDKTSNGKIDPDLKEGTLRKKSSEITTNSELLRKKSFDILEAKIIPITHIMEEKRMFPTSKSSEMEYNSSARRRTEMPEALGHHLEKYRTGSLVLPKKVQKKPSKRFQNAVRLLEAMKQTPLPTKISPHNFAKVEEYKNVKKEAEFAERVVKSLNALSNERDGPVSIKKIPLAGRLSFDVITKEKKDVAVKEVPFAARVPLNVKTREIDECIDASEDSKEKPQVIVKPADIKVSRKSLDNFTKKSDSIISQIKPPVLQEKKETAKHIEKEKEVLLVPRDSETQFYLATRSSIAIPATFEHHFEKYEPESLVFPKKMQRKHSERFQNAVKLLEAIQQTPLSTKIPSNASANEKEGKSVVPEASLAARFHLDAISTQKEKDVKKIPLVTRLPFDEIINGNKDVAIKEVPLSRSVYLDVQSKEMADDITSSRDSKELSQLVVMPAAIAVSEQSLDNLMKQSDLKVSETEPSRRKDSETDDPQRHLTDSAVAPKSNEEPGMEGLSKAGTKQIIEINDTTDALPYVSDNEVGFFEKDVRATKSSEITPSFIEKTLDKIIPTIEKQKTTKHKRR